MNKRQIAEFLLLSKAIKIEPASPFSWASGWKSPIYCDNRKTLSYPGIRTFIRDQFVEAINNNFEDVELIAGVATGAIAQGALVAEPKAIVIDREKCNGCGACIDMWPRGGLYKNEETGVCEVTDHSLCDKLAGCERTCPTGAIKIN